MLILLEEIEWDENLYPRVQVDWKTEYEYSDAMKAGDVFPPIEVVKKDGKYLGLDGRHRWGAAKRLGRKEIEAKVITLVQKEWFVHAVACNIKHGRRLSTFEKVKIAQRLRENFGVPVGRIASILAMPKLSLSRLLNRRLSAPTGALGGVDTKSGLFTQSQIALKAPFQHLAGRAVGSEVETAQLPQSSQSHAILLNQVLAIMQADAFDLENEEVHEKLEQIFVWLSDNTGRIYGRSRKRK